MKVLVTGASGFIGGHVIPELLAGGHEVIASSTRPLNARPWSDQVTWIPFSLDQPWEGDLFRFFQSPDALIHLAWQGLPNYKASFHVTHNLFRHFSFLQNMTGHGLQKMLVTGTCFEYGMQSGPLREDMTALPGNPYAIAKDSLRRFIEVLQQDTPFSFQWMRLFYMWGAGQNSRSLIPLLEQSVQQGEPEFRMSGGEQLRDYLPVEEVARILVAAVQQQKVQGIVNCCSGQPVSVRNFVEQYMRDHSLQIPLRLGHYPYPDYEPMAFWGDRTKLDQLLLA